MIKSVVVHETRGNIEEIDIDLLPEKNEIANLLGGNATFLGQWEDDLVVILVRASTENLELNANKLPRPFTNMGIFGKILMIRMDEESNPEILHYKNIRRWLRIQHREQTFGSLNQPRLSRSSGVLMAYITPMNNTVAISAAFDILCRTKRNRHD